MINKLIIVLIVLIIVACNATQPAFQPVESDVAKVNAGGSGVTSEDLKKGFRLYVSNCGGCHLLPAPTSKNKSAWDNLLPEMFSKTELDVKQKELIRQYIYSKL